MSRSDSGEPSRVGDPELAARALGEAAGVHTHDARSVGLSEDLERGSGLGVTEQAAVALDRHRRAAREDLDAEPFALGKDDRAVEETVRRVGHHDHPLGTR